MRRLGGGVFSSILMRFDNFPSVMRHPLSDGAENWKWVWMPRSEGREHETRGWGMVWGRKIKWATLMYEKSYRKKRGIAPGPSGTRRYCWFIHFFHFVPLPLYFLQIFSMPGKISTIQYFTVQLLPGREGKQRYLIKYKHVSIYVHTHTYIHSPEKKIFDQR